MEEPQTADAKTLPPCPRCADTSHTIVACPYVKAVEMAADGVTVVRVEFLTPADYGRQPVEAPPEADYPRMGPKV